MIRHIVFTSIIILWSFLNVIAQKTIIQSVEIEGLERTKKSYLNQFLSVKPGDVVVDSLISEDVQSLKNIAGIGNASYRLDTLREGVKLTYLIVEVRTLLPILNFGGVKGNVWFQIGFSDINWQGKGQFLSGAYQNNDQRHGGNIYYKIPRLRGGKLGLSVSLNRWSSREPLYFPEGTVNYDYDNTEIGSTIIKNFGFRRSLEIGGTYFVEKFTKSSAQILEMPPGPTGITQPKLLSKIIYAENFLNYHTFYLDGLAWKITIQDVYNTMDKTWFHSAQLQGRYYKRIRKSSNFGARMRFAIATNNATPFAPFVADSHVNIRGIGNRIDRGTAQFVLNLEIRKTVYENTNYGFQLVAFSDFGTWRNPGGNLEDLLSPSQFREFVGGGVRLIYKKIYGAVIRIDYAVDVFDINKNGFVLGVGQYF